MESNAFERDVGHESAAVGARYACRVVDDIGEVPAAEWNRLAGPSNPFVRHEFLRALERNGCVGRGTGWAPRHLVLEEQGRIVGAVPQYAKSHSYGEFVFDWGWADAYERAGHEYYPKLIAAAPFTPVPGPRLLVDDDGETPGRRAALISAAISIARGARLSSVHWLFTNDADTAALRAQDTIIRTGVQFHWRNAGYRDFADFLDSLRSRRRKSIRHERRDAATSGVDVEMIPGHAVTSKQWRTYHALYSSTYDRKWGYPSLTLGFFEEVAQTMGDSILLVLGRRRGRYVAGAHLFRGDDALFGRNWGCTEHHPCLHFEMCYYRGIEYCIDEGLARFEAGAQGEHKLMRGFLPVATRSAHWIAHAGFRDAIARFVAREADDLGRYTADLEAHSPFPRPA